MSAAISLAGGVLVGLVLIDVFHTLWHPAGQGRISRLVMRTVWAGSQRRLRPRSLRAMTGPLAMVLTVLTWGILVIAGFVLVYWPQMSGGFVFGSGLHPGERSNLLDALYLSLVTVATLGFGDIVPEVSWLRIVTPLQALVGFALLTAAVSWVLQIYAALGRRRSLAIQLTMFHRAQMADHLGAMHPATAGGALLSLVEQLARVRTDLTQYSETYYFRDADPDASLAAALRYALRLAEAGQQTSSPDTRVAGSAFEHALQDFTDTLTGERLIKSDEDGVEELVRAYEHDHA